MNSKLQSVLSWILWPLLMIICISATAIGFSYNQPLIGFNAGYVFLAVSLFFLERLMPHEREWHKPDGQTVPSLLHTLSSKGTVQGLFLFGGIIGVTQLMTPVDQAGPSYGVWPRDWPMAAQVFLGLLTAEFGLYWGHRMAHEWHPMWRFHAIHHSVKKLWIVNTGRFHFIDSLKSIVLALGILLLLGAPHEVVIWISAITAFIGMLTHCNVEMRFGPISYIFNTPELHRWHHSKDLREGNKNYGENLMLWDILFGTLFLEDRRPPVDIGIKEKDMPKGFLAQLVWPFKDMGLTFPHERPDWPYKDQDSRNA